MDKIEQLYNAYLKEGLISDKVTLEVWRNLSEDKLSIAYNAGKQRGLFDNATEQDFLNAWSTVDPVKKKDATVSASADGGSELSTTRPVNIQEEPLLPETPTLDSAPVQPNQQALDAVGQLPSNQQADLQVSDQVITAATPTLEAAPQTPPQEGLDYLGQLPELEKRQAQEEQKKQEEISLINKRQQEAVEDPLFRIDINRIDDELINMDEETAVIKLTNIYGKYGFAFTETGIGDAIKVLAPDGSTESIDLQTFFSDKKEAAKLRNFIEAKAQPKDTTIKIESDIHRSLKAKKLRDVPRQNPDGTISTVKFQSANIDGKEVVYPTLFPRNPDNYGSDPMDWKELDGMAAYEKALERGEVFEFDSEEEAQRFAEGGWKGVTEAEIEAESFYKERGYDYSLYRRQKERFLELAEKVTFINNAPIDQEDLPEGQRGKHPDLYINGKKRPDYQEIINTLTEEASTISDFIHSDKIRTASEDFDVYLDKKYQAKALEAVEENKIAKQKINEVEKRIEDYFGVPIADLAKIKPKNQTEFEVLNEMIIDYNSAAELSNLAGAQYEIANTYLDAKIDENLRGEFVENWAAVKNGISTGWDNGKAIEQVIIKSLGLDGLDEDPTTDEVAEALSQYLQDSQTGKISRAQYRFYQEKGVLGGLESFMDDPIELSLTLAGNSLSQMLPVGMKMIPAFTAAGATTGAAAGLAGGPFAELTVPAGAVTGAQWGARTGFAASNYAIEYGNAVLEAARDYDYDPMNPAQLAEAFKDERVWAQGKDIGMRRGIPIAIVDMLTAGLAGRVFPIARTAGTGERVLKGVAGQMALDPLGEGAGELAAQVSAGQGIDKIEILAEMIGAQGANTMNLAVNLLRDTRDNSVRRLSEDFQDIKKIATEDISDEKITSWSNRMEKLGKITPEENLTIQKNVGLRREARDLLNVQDTKKRKSPTGNPPVEGRLMELLDAKETLTATPNRRSVFSKKIAQINNEISEIASTKKLIKRPTEIESPLRSLRTAEQKPVTPEVTDDTAPDATEEVVPETVEDVEETVQPEVAQEIVDINDEDTVELAYESLEDVPEEFRGDATEAQNVRKKSEVGGLPIGEDTGDTIENGFVITKTGKQIKEYAVQKNKLQVEDGINETQSEETAELPTAQEEVIESIEPSQETEQRFRSGEISNEERDGVLAHIATKRDDRQELTPFEREFAEANKDRMKEVVSIKRQQDAYISRTQELKDFEERFFPEDPVTQTTTISDKFKAFVELLSRSFPSIEVVTDQVEFENLISNLLAKKLITKGQVVFGVVYEGKVYLNPNIESFNAAVHEFGHIWQNVAKQVRPELHEKGLSLIKGTSYVDNVKKSPEYKRVVKAMKNAGATDTEIEAYLLEEALATAIGDKGGAIVESSVRTKFEKWMKDLFDFLKRLTGISEYTSEELQNISLDEFLQGVVVDLLSGRELFEDAQIESMTDHVQLMTGRPIQSTDLNTIVFEGRQAGYPDDVIKQVLRARGFKVKEINAAMEVVLDISLLGDVIMPGAFGQVEGGAKQGVQLFESIVDPLKSFLKRKQTEPPKTRGEIRAKAMELLKSNPIYNAQVDEVQMELVLALDRAIGTKANIYVQREIANIRRKIDERKIAKEQVENTKRQLRDFIRKALPAGSIGYTKGTVVRMMNRITKATSKTILADIEKILREVVRIRAAMKRDIVKRLLKEVNRAAKVRKTASGKSRSSGLDYEGQSYFKESKRVLKMVLSGDVDGLDLLQQTVSDNSHLITQALRKDPKDRTNEDNDLINKYEAYVNFYELGTMELEDAQRLFSKVKFLVKESRKIHSERQAAWAEQIGVLTDEVEGQVSNDFPEILNEDGNPMDDNELAAKLSQIRKLYDDKKYLKWTKEYLGHYKFKAAGQMIESITNTLKHLGTLMNKLDKSGKFFTKHVYDRLNRSEENYLKGYYNVQERLDTIANSIDGITDGMKGIRKLLYGNSKLNLKLKTQNAEGKYNWNITKDELLRVYALYKDPVQRKLLIGQGFDTENYDKVVEFLGPELTDFADKIVNYLSNEHYEGVNKVYRQVNDVNLSYIAQYFPTRAIHSPQISPESSFVGSFNAEFSPALKDRTNKSSDVKLDINFSTTLEQHIDTMERYKAYAVPTKILQGIFNDGHVKALLQSLGLSKAVNHAIKYAINPKATFDPTSMPLIDRLQSKFTAFALGLKIIQIPKQATSFINAFEDYNFRPGRYTPGLDLLMFGFDGAVLAANLLAEISVMGYEKITGKNTGFEGPLSQAMGMSASFRDRVRQGFEGDLVGLYSGQPSYRDPQTNQAWWAKLSRQQKRVVASPTTIGDIMGVMGYMINYRRNIKNGMPKATALKAFNNYNSTQQSRRPTEKAPLQISRNTFTRMFTMFSSVLFLQINKVMQASTNLSRQTNEAIKTRDPSKIKIKDIRAMYINLGAANVFFTGMANIFKLFGEDEDREEAMRQMAMAMAGLNLLYKIPGMSFAMQAKADLEGEYKKVQVGGVDPVMQIYNKWKSAVVYDDENAVLAASKILAELSLGFQFDPLVGAASVFTGEFDEEAMYDLLGVSYSYRPKVNEKQKGMTKTELRKRYPELYRKYYGK